MSARVCVVARLVGISVMLGCHAGESTSNADGRYEAALTGAQERPVQTRSTASGSAVVTVSGKTATYVVTANGFTTPLTAGHIHIGAEAVTGQVVVPFVIAAQSGTVATGTIDLGAPITYNTLTISGDSLRTLFETGRAYVNLHTAAWPDGEIRGQLIRR